jgi:hypothetical protein
MGLPYVSITVSAAPTSSSILRQQTLIRSYEPLDQTVEHSLVERRYTTDQKNRTEQFTRDGNIIKFSSTAVPVPRTYAARNPHRHSDLHNHAAEEATGPGPTVGAGDGTYYTY